MDDRNRLRLALNVVVVSAVFTGLVALLLLLNFYQFSKKDPLDGKALDVLVHRLSENPDDEGLRNDIRNLDLLARKAYFNSRWQIRTGSHLMLFGAIVFAVALRRYYSLKSRIEFPGQTAGNEITQRILSRKGIWMAGAALLAFSLAASYFSNDRLKSFESEKSGEIRQDIPPEKEIEVVEVGAGTLSSAPESTGVAEPAAVVEIMQEKTDAPKVVQADIPVDPSLYKSNYPSFRGPFGNGVTWFKNVPVDFDGPSGRNILWKVAIPLPGNNSPVIWGDKLFLTGASSLKREIYCYDRFGGKLLWTVVADNIPGSPGAVPKVTDDTGLAAPSVATDGRYVFAIFATGDLLAVDMNGSRVWAKNLGVPDNHYGHSSSLLVLKDKLYVQYDTNKARKLMAFSVISGQLLWETNRNVKISWASPILANIGGKYQVILSADPLVAGYDAETGKEAWSSAVLSGEVGPSPAFGEGLVFAANEYARLVAIHPGDGRIVWEADEYLPEVSSPVANGGFLFIATSYGVLACYDAKSGAKLWENDSGTGYYSSPVVADNKLFIFDTEGTLQVYAISGEKNLLSESVLGEKVFTTPAFSNGRMYIRAGGSLFCIGSKEE
jgi:outer membrane protein assembly factor BamB